MSSVNQLSCPPASRNLSGSSTENSFAENSFASLASFVVENTMVRAFIKMDEQIAHGKDGSLNPQEVYPKPERQSRRTIAQSSVRKQWRLRGEPPGAATTVP